MALDNAGREMRFPLLLLRLGDLLPPLWQMHMGSGFWEPSRNSLEMAWNQTTTGTVQMAENVKGEGMPVLFDAGAWAIDLVWASPCSATILRFILAITLLRTVAWGIASINSSKAQDHPIQRPLYKAHDRVWEVF